MANTFAVSRVQLIYVLCLPVAVLLGYLLTDPTETTGMAMVTLMIAALSVPLLMRWHHVALICTWNAAITPYFIPGRPYLWMLVAGTSLFFAILNRSSSIKARFSAVPSISWSLLALLVVVVLTAATRGGIGAKFLGSSNFGGKGYFYTLAAVIGYFALTSQRISKQHAGLLVAVFFLSNLTVLVPNLAYMGGSKLDFLYYFFPPDFALEQAIGDYSINAQFVRIFGLTGASCGVFYWLLSQYGLRGVFDLTKPWRLALFGCALVACAYCGFRTIIVLFLLTTAVQFFLEGLFKPRSILVACGLTVLIAALVLPNSEKLPFVVQRAISFLPVNINPAVKAAADYSSEWRFEMWRRLLPEVQRYFFLGKGYVFDSSELTFADENMRRGYVDQFTHAMVAGDYHNGPLSLIIPFGIWGVLAFIAFTFASLRFLYRNYRYGDPDFKTINTFFLTYFIVRIIFFCGVFGGFYGDICVFAGVVGMSVSLNGTDAYEPKPADVETTELSVDEEFASAI